MIYFVHIDKQTNVIFLVMSLCKMFSTINNLFSGKNLDFLYLIERRICLNACCLHKMKKLTTAA